MGSFHLWSCGSGLFTEHRVSKRHLCRTRISAKSHYAVRMGHTLGHWDYAAVSMREGDQCVWWKRARGGLSLALKSGVHGRRHPPPAEEPRSPKGQGGCQWPAWPCTPGSFQERYLFFPDQCGTCPSSEGHFLLSRVLPQPWLCPHRVQGH